MAVQLNHTIVYVRDKRESATFLAEILVEPDFDRIFGRIRARELPYWADPGRRRPGEINTNDGGRGVYWEEPSGHFLEIITRPYGSGG